MAIKKTELYSTIWKSCDELRGGMDASMYKDYVLVMLFLKYISDKYANVPYAPITVPKGSSFDDMVKLKGSTDIGDKINKKILAPIGKENKISDFPDFNDVNKLGSGQEMVKRLGNLIAIFEDPELDFSQNRADGDDILGDAYEYLMRHFATQSGKSKGQFYTPSEVSRIMAKIIGVQSSKNKDKTAYDPTSGSGSLLLKVYDESDGNLTLYGQEMDVATASLARMNMILHNCPTASIVQGNTLANPKFLEKNELKLFDYFVSNPPFSFSAWMNGIDDPINDTYNRFKDYGIPPQKNGDYAFLIHAIKSLKTNGKGAIILPHGVLFRGNAEGEIRKNLIQRGYIKGIIGLPPNLFYGTGIPACIIIIDKEEAQIRKEIFIIDASKGFIKDGSKNRLREQDIHKIVDTFTKQLEIPKYSRLVPVTEIEAKEFNLNIPRYIDNSEDEDIHDIEAHLHGGIPAFDIDAWLQYWETFPSLREELFEKIKGKEYFSVKVEKENIKKTILENENFLKFKKSIDSKFTKWKKDNIEFCKSIGIETMPKEFIHTISESFLATFKAIPLVDAYDLYQHLMSYWEDEMQDDLHLIVVEGWQSEKKSAKSPTPSAKGKKGKTTDDVMSVERQIIPSEIMIQEYFTKQKHAIEDLENKKDGVASQISELVEEHSEEEWLLSEAKNDKETVTKTSVTSRLKAIQNEKEYKEEIEILEKYLELSEEEASFNKEIKAKTDELNRLVEQKYNELTLEDIKTLVVEKKWYGYLSNSVFEEIERVGQKLTSKVSELSERYESPVAKLEEDLDTLESKVNTHLEAMGYKL
jgi:type I restriction enzyme M protein